MFNSGVYIKNNMVNYRDIWTGVDMEPKIRRLFVARPSNASVLGNAKLMWREGWRSVPKSSVAGCAPTASVGI
jgi:hypothetical protein